MLFSYNCLCCCMVLSIWGTIQLIIMGILYRMEILTLINDVEPHTYGNYTDFIKKTRHNYRKVARNCWLAAIIYFMVFIISYISVKRAKRLSMKRALEREDDELNCPPSHL